MTRSRCTPAWKAWPSSELDELDVEGILAFADRTGLQLLTADRDWE